MTISINVGEDFYPRPAGRFYEDGSHSGQRFREEYLLPSINKLAEGEKLHVDFSTVTMAGSSFLEESFGGLIRKRKISREKLLSILEVTSKRKIIIKRIYEYIDDARPE
ncbi:STAS-like domain-containing protein [Acinetobacter guillouiae]|uniref:STAS-like domain-containing protein n=1 Tax=Acinetobacter guillouiae TaxID=106649 RepID=UPI0026E31978|nr:STAS-like domain-containing protein [Acinetobacter guillouiae]MDO6646340.1 STAS-like domain-containing protein [Acinetobacter guillouiae]